LAEIRERAFEIHIERGGIHGCDLDDWLQAERELQEKLTRATTEGRKRNDQHINTIVLAIAKTLFTNKPEENSMLKISFSETPAEERWILHGRLIHPWVQELRTCWKKNHRADARRACIVDLNEVTFIDKSGERSCASWLKKERNSRPAAPTRSTFLST